MKQRHDGAALRSAEAGVKKPVARIFSTSHGNPVGASNPWLKARGLRSRDQRHLKEYASEVMEEVAKRAPQPGLK